MIHSEPSNSQRLNRLYECTDGMLYCHGLDLQITPTAIPRHKKEKKKLIPGIRVHNRIKYSFFFCFYWRAVHNLLPWTNDKWRSNSSIYSRCCLFYYSNTHLKSHNNGPGEMTEWIYIAVGVKYKSTIDRSSFFKYALMMMVLKN